MEIRRVTREGNFCVLRRCCSGFSFTNQLLPFTFQAMHGGRFQPLVSCLDRSEGVRVETTRMNERTNVMSVFSSSTDFDNNTLVITRHIVQPTGKFLSSHLPEWLKNTKYEAKNLKATISFIVHGSENLSRFYTSRVSLSPRDFFRCFVPSALNGWAIRGYL